MTRLYALVGVLSLVLGAGCGGTPSATPTGFTPKGSAPSPGITAGPAESVIVKMNGSTRIAKDQTGRDVYHVQFERPGPKDDDLRELRRVLADHPIAVDLNVGGDEQITDAGLANLKGWKTLHALLLDSKQITDAGLANLADLSSLEELLIGHDGLTDAGLAHVGKLTNLRQLRFYSSKITPAGFAHLSGLTKIEELSVGGSLPDLGDVELSHLTMMNQLRVLRIGGKSLTDAGMAQLKNFPELRDLTIYIASGSHEVTSKGVANLAHLKKLEKLLVRSCWALRQDMSALKDLKDLRDLNIQSCGGLNSQGLANLSGLPKLRIVNLEDPDDKALQGLEGARAIEELTLSSVLIGDEGVKYLTQLTGLKRLDLTNTRVTAAGIAELKKSLLNTKIVN